VSDPSDLTSVVKWHLTEPGRSGVKNLRFGDVQTDIINNHGIIHVNSNKPYALIINGEKYDIFPGQMRFDLKQLKGP